MRRTDLSGKVQATLPCPSFRVLISLAQNRKNVLGVERKGTSGGMQSARLALMPFGRVPQKGSRLKLKTVEKEKETGESQKGVERATLSPGIASGTRQPPPGMKRRHANIFILVMGTANGEITAVTVMTEKRGEREKGHLLFFSPRKSKRQRRTLLPWSSRT